jgi:uncharacterized protein (DUF736 family)
MQVGTFRRIDTEIRGEVRTLTLAVELRLVPVFAGRGSMAPSHMIMAGEVEVGAAWPASPGSLRTLKVRIDDPSFPAPLVGELTETNKEEMVLIWKRASWRG